MNRLSPLPRPLLSRPFSTPEAQHTYQLSRSRLRGSDLAAPHRGVRVVAANERDLGSRCRAYAEIMADGHAFSHTTAAMLHGMPLPQGVRRDRLHVTAPEARRAPRASGIAGHKSSVRLRLVRIEGMRVLSAADTWCTVATMLSVDALICAGDRLLGLPFPLETEARIRQALARYGRRSGAAKLKFALDEMRADAYSAPETLTRLALVRSGLPEPEPNGPIRLRSGSTTRGDLVFREWRVLVEYDGEHHLTDPGQWAKDVARLNDLAQDGWLVIRITKRMPHADVVTRTRVALLERGWSGGAAGAVR